MGKPVTTWPTFVYPTGKPPRSGSLNNYSWVQTCDGGENPIHKKIPHQYWFIYVYVVFSSTAIFCTRIENSSPVTKGRNMKSQKTVLDKRPRGVTGMFSRVPGDTWQTNGGYQWIGYQSMEDMIMYWILIATTKSKPCSMVINPL